MFTLIRSLPAIALLFASAATAQTYSKTETITYHDNMALWVLGQVAKVTCAAAVPASTSCDGDATTQTTYDATTALPTATYAFGKLQSTMTYGADGTLRTVADGNNRVTTLSSWYRGIPRSIVYADGKSQSAVVNPHGWITSVTDEAGVATSYGYDSMGRVNKITYPTGDSTVWNATNIAFVPVATAEYGIAAGHWRQTISTGDGRKVTYYDALWRQLLTREYDASNVAATDRYMAYSHDALNRQVYAAYPVAVAPASSAGSWTLPGVRTAYDALGRVTSVTQDSELGPLITTTQYLSGFQTRVTNPRGHATTTQFVAYDQPVYDQPVRIDAPESTTTLIQRDPFGKPLQITRGATP